MEPQSMLEPPLVRIETILNVLNIQPGPGTSRVLGKPFYVIQTTIYFSLGRSGAKRDIVIEGAHLSRPDAVAVAKKVLLEPDLLKDTYIKYNEYYRLAFAVMNE